MSESHSAGAPASNGARFRAALAAESPLQVVGAITAYAGLMAKHTGYKALYLSGGGVAANSLGMPDLGISTMEDVLTDARRIVEATQLPLLVDIDTGWGGAFNIARTVRSAGVAPSTSRARSVRSSALAWPPCTWKTRSGRSVAVIGPARKWCRKRKWWIA